MRMRRLHHCAGRRGPFGLLNFPCVACGTKHGLGGLEPLRRPGPKGTGVKFIVEILKANGGAEPPQLLHSFAHKASSVHMVREAMRAVVKSPQWPLEANGFRIIDEAGAELYRWPD
jgi:hypothetical protein